MDMTNTTQADPAARNVRDKSNPGEVWAFVVALVIVAALVIGFLFGGVPGMTIVMVAIVPVIYIVLVTVSVGG